MTFELVVSILLAQFGGVLGFMQYYRGTLEKWCKEMFVLKSDFAQLQERVRSIDADVREIKARTQQIYEILLEKR